MCTKRERVIVTTDIHKSLLNQDWTFYDPTSGILICQTSLPLRQSACLPAFPYPFLACLTAVCLRTVRDVDFFFPGYWR